MVDEMHKVANPDEEKTEDLVRHFRNLCEDTKEGYRRMLRKLKTWLIDFCPVKPSHRTSELYAAVDEVVNKFIRESTTKDPYMEEVVRRKQRGKSKIKLT